MADRYDLLVAREGKDGKTFWTKVGVMFKARDKDGFSLSFEALPIPSLSRDGKLEVRVNAFPPQPRDGQTSHNQAKSNGYAPVDDGLADDALPF